VRIKTHHGGNNVRLSLFRTAICAVVLAVAGPALADDVSDLKAQVDELKARVQKLEQPDWKFEMHGIASGSFLTQYNQTLFWGGGAMFVVGNNQSGVGTVTPNKTGANWTTGGDVRQNRFNFSLAGPKVFGGATPKAVLEIDFFNHDGPGRYGDVSLTPRMRLAYAELNWGGNTILRFGQDWELLAGILIPETVGHMAYPLTFMAGTVTWREPCIEVFQYIPLGKDQKIELALSMLQSSWNAEGYGLGETIPTALGINTWGSGMAAGGTNQGQDSALPGFEARVKYMSKMFTAFAAGHWNKVHLAGYSAAATPAVPDIDVLDLNVGLQFSMAGFLLKAVGFTGQNQAPLVATMLQFTAGPCIHEYGGWFQLGYENSGLGAYFTMGVDHPEYQDIVQAGSLGLERNVMTSGMVRYRDGGFAVALEYAHWLTTGVVGGAIVNGNATGDQLMVTGAYFF